MLENSKRPMANQCARRIDTPGIRGGTFFCMLVVVMQLLLDGRQY